MMSLDPEDTAVLIAILNIASEEGLDWDEASELAQLLAELKTKIVLHLI